MENPRSRMRVVVENQQPDKDNVEPLVRLEHKGSTITASAMACM